MHGWQAISVHSVYIRGQPQESRAEFYGSCLDNVDEVSWEIHSQSLANTKETRIECSKHAANGTIIEWQRKGSKLIDN